MAEELSREEEIRRIVLGGTDLSRSVSDADVLARIREAICVIGRRETVPLRERRALERTVFNSLRKLDVLQELIEDDEVTEIMVNGPDHIFIEMNGQIRETGLHFASPERLLNVIQMIVAAQNRIVNESTPIVDARLSDGSRVNIVLPPVAVDYGILTIRKFPKEPITMDVFLQKGSLSEEIAAFLQDLVRSGYNIFISGGTSSGKTTFLNALTEFIPPEERVITIEDSAELQVLGIPNLVRLESRDKNLEGRLEIPIRDLVRTSLRMRPDRIIVGECRGAETLEMLQAINTGHDGSMSTGHANSARDMLSRLETMVLMGMDLPLPAIRKQIASGIDIIIHLKRMQDRSRRVFEIAEVTGCEDGEVTLRTLFIYEGEGRWAKQNELMHTEKLIRSGRR